MGFVARLPLLSADDPDVDPKAREVLSALRGLRGRELNVYRAIANHPDLLQTMVSFGTAAYFRNSLTPAQRELAYLTASVTNDCHY